MDSEKPLDHSSSTPLSAVSRHLADGRYILVRKVAEGGTAYVFLGYDTWTETWRAIKTLLPEYAKRPALRHRFEKEAATMKTLSHDNIIAVYDAGIDGDTVFMVMEFAEGGSVIDWVEDNGPMPPRMATQVVLELCRGIEAAHRQGVIHRDIKPQNLLVDRNGVCKVTDFGIAQVIEDTRMTMTGTVMGTMGYMAPEQNESAKHADERADVYSIAATFYTLVKGEAATHLFMADEHDFDGIPESLVTIIRKGSNYKRELRYQTVRDLMAELEGALRLLSPDPLDTPPIVAEDMPNLEDFTPPSFDAGVNALVPIAPVEDPPSVAGEDPYQSEPPFDEPSQEWVIGLDPVDDLDDPHSLEKSTTPQLEFELDQPDQFPEIRPTPQPPVRAQPNRANREVTRAIALALGTVAALGVMIVVLMTTIAAGKIERLEADAADYHRRIMRISLEQGQSTILPRLDNLALQDRACDGSDELRQKISELRGTDDRRVQQALARRIHMITDTRVVPSCWQQSQESGKVGTSLTIRNWKDALLDQIDNYDRVQAEIDRERETRGGQLAGCAGIVQ